MAGIQKWFVDDDALHLYAIYVQGFETKNIELKDNLSTITGLNTIILDIAYSEIYLFLGLTVACRDTPRPFLLYPLAWQDW